MQTSPICKVKDNLSDLVDAAMSTREQVTITRNGLPAAVLIGVDEWESLQETLFCLSQPDVRETIQCTVPAIPAATAVGPWATRDRYCSTLRRC